MTRIAAAINASPESFFKGSVASGDEALDEALRRAERAELLDVGAMSTAPYLETQISEAEETGRLNAAIRYLRSKTTKQISADTQRVGPAQAALDLGAQWINDVNALRDNEPLAALIAERHAGVILMANDDAGLDEAGRSPAEVVRDLLASAADRALRAGIARERIILDPGVGFFRQRSIPWFEWDLELLRNLALFRSLGYPLMVGASRKSLFKPLLGRERPEDRLAGSLAVAAACARERVEWLRVHDVEETSDVLRMLSLLYQDPTG